MTAWRINDLINKAIKLRPSLDSAPFDFQSVANTIRASTGSILDRELVKASLGINCGLEMGLAYDVNGGSVYALFKAESGWGLFQNVSAQNTRHLEFIFPESLDSSIRAMVRPVHTNEASTPSYEWANVYSCFSDTTA